MRRLAVVVALLGLSLGMGLGGSGCATPAPRSAITAPPRAPHRLPPPRSRAEAESYLAGSLAAMRAGHPEHAVLFLDAILHSDHLTERGRANVYWLAAEAHRLDGDEDALVDALGGFLVAATVVPADDELVRREVEARATLLARKVKNLALFGKSPDEAIPIDDPREASGVVAELGCGKNGDAPWVEDRVSAVPAAGARRLEQRRLICSDTGESLVLWFDVSQAR